MIGEQAQYEADKEDRDAYQAEEDAKAEAIDQISKFQFTPEMVRTMGRGAAYMDVKWRILWFRHENPKRGELVSELVEMSKEHAVFKCTAITDTGAKATGYGSETAKDFGDFIEKAETKARGRALEALGYGTAAMMNDGDRIADAPVERPSPPRPQQSRPAVQAVPDVDEETVNRYLYEIDTASSIFALDDIGNDIAARGIKHDGLRAAFRTKKLMLTGGA